MQLLNSYLLISSLNSSETKPVHDPASSLPIGKKGIQSALQRKAAQGSGDKQHLERLEALAIEAFCTTHLKSLRLTNWSGPIRF